MNLQKTTTLFLVLMLSVSCISTWPIGQFEVSPYTRSIDVKESYGEEITVILDPLIQQIQLIKLHNGKLSDRLFYNDYRSSVERSIHNLLENSFETVRFATQAPEQGLVFHVHRLIPKSRPGEISNFEFFLEFAFDYDMSLAYNGKSIANAVDFNAHPTTAYDNWQTASQTSLKLVLEESYNKMFVASLVAK